MRGRVLVARFIFKGPKRVDALAADPAAAGGKGDAEACPVALVPAAAGEWDASGGSGGGNMSPDVVFTAEGTIRA